MTNERLEQLLIKCMDWIETENDETVDTFEYLGFEADELEELGFGYLNEWLNVCEKRLISKLEEAKRYCKGELELDLVDGIWVAMDYREDLEGAFSIDVDTFDDEIISVSEAERQGIDVIKCCDECDISYVG